MGSVITLLAGRAYQARLRTISAFLVNLVVHECLHRNPSKRFSCCCCCLCPSLFPCMAHGRAALAVIDMTLLFAHA